MVNIRRILCPIDFSESSVKAYEYAESLARRYDAELCVQHLVELWSDPVNVPPTGIFDEYRQTVLQEREARLDKFVEACSRSGIQSKRYVREGLPADHILAVAKDQAMDLIVMGTHGRRGLNRFMLGSVTERVLRQAPCPVLVVRRRSSDSIDSGSAGGPAQIRRILCCTDFSAPSEKPLDHAFSLQGEYSADLVVLHVLDETSDASAAVEGTTTAKRQLEQLLGSAAGNRDAVKAAVRLGRAYEQIIQAATEMEADLIVMGIRGRNSLDAAVFGSTTYRVIQLGPCPVLVVPA